MKQLVIPEQHDIDLGSYGPACEGFIDAIKGLFVKKDPSKERIEVLKKSSYDVFDALEKELENDLHRTYDNSAWVEKNLANNSGFITIQALATANFNGKELTKPEELVKIAREMMSVLKEIAAREKPFIEFRRKLTAQVDKMTDPKQVDKVWEENAKQLSISAVDRQRQKYKKGFPAFGHSTMSGGSSWPVSYKNAKADWFGGDAQVKTDGKIEAPTATNAKHFADAIRALMEVCTDTEKVWKETYIPYWDSIGVEYDDLKHGDDIFSYLYSSQGDQEVADLATDIKYDIGHIIAGLYIAMFDKHMPVPANEGLIGDAVNFIFPKKKKKAEEKPAQQSYDDFYKQREKLEQKLKEFLDNPSGFRLTGKAYSAGAYMHLSINGRSPVITHLPAELAKTFKAAETLANKFKKDMKQHAGIAIPLMGQFEKDMLAVMEKDGSVPQEALDKAMLPIITAKSKLDSTYFNSFGKDQHIADHWVGGNPFKMISHKRNDGSIGWTDESYDIKQPHVAVDKVDKIETLSAMLNAILPYMEDSGLWVKSNGPFDTDSDDVKRPDYEFDRPVRHLSDYMSNEQTSAIYALYSFEENTQSLHYRLCDAIEKVLESVVVYISGSIEKIQ